MKTLFTLLCLALFSPIFSQNSTIYYDSTWEETTQDKHVYYRKWEKNADLKSKEAYIVKDYFKTGELQMTGSFRDSGFGKKQGEFKWYTQTGTLTEHRFYEDGKKIGEHKTWNKEGKPLAIVHYKNDSLHGEYITFDRSGTIYDQENYQYGKQNGWSYYYYPNSSQLSSKEFYEKDSLLKFETYTKTGKSSKIAGTPYFLPAFPGGTAGLRAYLGNTLNYPEKAQVEEKEGKCYLTFLVDSIGQISDVTVKKGVPNCPECDMEAVRVVAAMPLWVPGLDHNRKRDFYFNLPIIFRLTDNKKTKKRRGRG